MAKILTIEDSAFERKAIVRMLKNAGYEELIEAGSGEEGIRLFKEKKPDLVLLDLRMPGMPGMQALEELKKIDSDVKVIVVSIVRKKSTINEAINKGVQAYVKKPITKNKLIPPVKEALGEQEG